MERLINIYRLVDPLSKEVRYIGITYLSVEERLDGHLSDARYGAKGHKANWLRDLMSKGYKPLVEIIDVVLERHWSEMEKFWIKFYRVCGANLTNTAEGGRGVLGVKHSLESREKNRNAHLGKPHSPTGKAAFDAERQRRIERRKNGEGYHTEEEINRMKKSRTEFPTKFWLGKKLPESIKENIKKSWINRRLKYGPSGGNTGRKQKERNLDL